MGCFPSKPKRDPKAAAPHMAPAYPQSAYPHSHGQHPPVYEYPQPPHQSRPTAPAAYYPPPPVDAPTDVAPSAPPLVQQQQAAPGGGGYYTPPPLDVAVPPTSVPVAVPLRNMLSLDCNRIGWLAAPSADQVSDYVYRREVKHTGHVIDDLGNQVGVICDITPHQVDPAEGLPLSGKATFGKYVTDGNSEETLGCVEINAGKFCNATGVAMTVALRVKLTKKLQSEGCLFYAGDGWCNHFSIKHHRGETRFEACPGNEGKWNSRVEVAAKMDLPVGKVLSIVAVLQETGEMELWVDGQRAATGPGLKNVNGFEISQRHECFVGRWMRPDQSAPTHASLFTLDIFDGAMSEKDVMAHHSCTANNFMYKPRYQTPPVVNFA